MLDDLLLGFLLQRGDSGGYLRANTVSLGICATQGKDVRDIL